MIDASLMSNYGVPVWIIGFFIIVGAFITLSKQVAELKGVLRPLGVAARWWQDKQKRTIDKASTANELIENAAERRYGKRMDDMEKEMEGLREALAESRREHREDIAEWRQERDEMESNHHKEMQAQRIEVQMYAELASEMARRQRNNAIWLAEQGLEYPPPPFPDIVTWRKEWMKKHGLE